MEQGLLQAGTEYQIQARICYVDDNFEDTETTVISEATEPWDENVEKNGTTVLLAEQGFRTNYTSPTEADFTISRGTNPVMSISADYAKNSTDSDGLKMTINLYVNDPTYNTGVLERGKDSVTAGKVYVKVYDKNTGNEVTENFRCGNSPLKAADGSYQYVDARTSLDLIWEKNTNYNHPYYVEVWGTTNGVHHVTEQCSCGSDHAGVDEAGNVLLVTSVNDEMTGLRLTMPGASGISIRETELIYNNGSITLQVQVGSSYALLQSAIVTIDAGAGEYVSVNLDKIAWSGSSFTFKIEDPEDVAKIRGTCSISFAFTYAGSSEPYNYSRSFTVN